MPCSLLGVSLPDFAASSSEKHYSTGENISFAYSSLFLHLAGK